MIELIDVDDNIKFMGKIITGINYGDNLYVLYFIERDKNSYNLFISKVIENSVGYVMDNNFFSGEKEAIDNVVASILNKDSIDILKEKGIFFVNDISFTDINRFSVSNCYVTTFNKILFDECMLFYDFKIDNNKSNVVVREKEVSYLSENNRPYVYLIILGIFVIIISIVVVVNFIK